MSERKQRISGGISFLGMLTILFIALKLTGHIHWSWVWVLAPLWGPFAAGILLFSLSVGFVFLLGLLVLLIGGAVNWLSEKSRENDASPNRAQPPNETPRPR